MKKTILLFLGVILLLGCAKRVPVPPAKPRSTEELAFAALYAGRTEEVRLRLQQGASLEARDPRKGQTLLMKAAENDNVEPVEILLKAGANTETKSLLFQKTALFFSAYRGCDNVTKLLLENGANPNALDENGNNPLREAILGGHASSVRLLVSAGANPDQVNNKGMSMIDIAKGTGSQEILDSLLKKE